MKEAVVRFYVDADILGLAKVLASLNPEVTYPGDRGEVIKRVHRPPCIIASPAVKDTVWVPQVAAEGWLILPRDSAIQQHAAEVNAVRSSGARMVALHGDDARGTWAQLRIVLKHWSRIEELAATPGPFIHRATLNKISSIDLASPK
jgi:hypothetical protein